MTARSLHDHYTITATPGLQLEQRDGLDVGGPGELVDELQRRELVTVVQKDTGFGRVGRSIVSIDSMLFSK